MTLLLWPFVLSVQVVASVLAGVKNAAPSYTRSEVPDWGDPSFGRRIDDYYGPFPGI